MRPVMTRERVADPGTPGPRLNVYHLERTDNLDFGQLRGAVIIAVSVIRARELAAECAGYEGAATWFSSRVGVHVIGVAVPGQMARVVSTDRTGG